MAQLQSADGDLEAILKAIAALRPEDRQRLFRLLAEQGDLPSQGVLPLPIQLPFAFPARPSSPPDYVLTFDGGSKGNPGLGYGSYAILRVKDGAQRLERLEFGDGWTNNEAEYDALIASLRDLIERIEEGGRRPQEFAVTVRGDSALVIHQLQGKWRVKEPRLRERRDECFRLLRRFGSVELVAQPREESVRILGH
jgi:ribonuclease HI